MLNFELPDRIAKVFRRQVLLLEERLEFLFIAKLLSLMLLFHLKELACMKFLHFLALLNLVVHSSIFFSLFIGQLRVEFLLFKSQLVLQSKYLSFLGVAQAFDPVFRVTFSLNQLFLRQIYLLQQLPLQLALD